MELVSSKNYLNLAETFFETIQNGCKSNRMLSAWTEICHEILAGQQVPMWNLQKTIDIEWHVTMVCHCKTVYAVETYRLFTKEGHADSLPGYDRPILLFLWCSYKQCASYCQLCRQNSQYLLNDPPRCIPCTIKYYTKNKQKQKTV